MKHIKIYEYFKDSIEHDNYDLALELEFKFRTSNADDKKNKSIFDILKELGIQQGVVTGVDLGKILQLQMKFKKQSDEEFLKMYNEYKKNSEI